MVTRKTAIAAVAACSLSAVALAATSFSDVPTDHWASDAIMWANDSQIMTGPGDMPGMFNPSGDVNRAQLAVVSQRLYTKIMADVDAKMMEEGSMDDGSVDDGSMDDGSSEEDMSAWMTDEDGIWDDADGNMVRVAAEGGLEYSADGRNWAALEGDMWMGVDGYSYKVDADGMVMMSMDGGETWAAADMWPGSDGMWYMFDEEGNLWNMSSWMADEDGIWTDSAGNMLRMNEGILEWSEDGTEWMPVAGSQWTASDGSLYRFEDDLSLSMSNNDGGTWVEANMWPGTDGGYYKLDADGMLVYMEGYDMMGQ